MNAQGAAVHLLERHRPRLRLLAMAGLPPAFAEAWDQVSVDRNLAPAEAVRRSCPAGRTDAPDQLGSIPGPDAPCPRGARVLVVPLGPDTAPVGTLSVLLDRGQEPGEARLSLRAAAIRLHGHLAGPPRGRGPTTADTPSGSGEGQGWMLDAAQVGTYDCDVRTGQLFLDERACLILGLNPETFDSRYETWAQMVHPEDLSPVSLPKAVVGRYDCEYRVTRPAGDMRWIRAGGLVLPGPDGRPGRAVGTLFDNTGSHAPPDGIAYKLEHPADGVVLTGADGRITYVNVQAEGMLRTSRSDLLGRILWEAVPYPGEPGLEARCREAAATGLPTEFDVHVPALGTWYGLRITSREDGLTLSLSDITESRLRAAERVRVEHGAALRTTRTQELTAALSEAVTVQDVVDAVGDHLLTPFGGTGLVVQTLEGDRLRVVGHAGYSESFLSVLESAPVTQVSPTSDSLRTRTPVFIGSGAEYGRRYPHLKWRIGPSGMQAWAFLPLIVSGRPIGCCIIAFREPGQLDEEERALLAALSGLVAHALERARLYDAEHARAVELQRGLLPQVLPQVPGAITAVRYLPASEGLEVGGDWYDVIPLSGDRVALVIGDVMGHGLPEAATMGRLRTAVHTLADLEMTPEDLLTQLNDLVSRLGEDFYATFLYAIYDPTARTATFARSGHPPPALVHPGGEIDILDLPNNPPLGVGTPPFETVELELPDQSLLAFYTDGLVETRGRDIESGINALSTALTDALADPLTGTETTSQLDRLCETLTTALTSPNGAEDDAVLFLARPCGLPREHVADWALPDSPLAAGEARSLAAAQLRAWRLEPLVDITALLVSELVTNAVRHGRGPIRLRLLRSQSLVCEVSDGSTTTPRVRRAAETDEGGRGLAMVTLLAQRWGTRHSTHGKTIWAEQPLPPAAVQ
ncbi:SpoIIE family protein phosphatase [Streptomyces himalayensis]|uniref:protein-serine/threonine phosphatase n=1 Tax=Streptomyces himalayensis subsp. himalayensis TaxID=2756131 RepID=A0A7W0DIL4_9ACTN|nr:SpoIIE family protein phosphatase [Streptomyces himalayensis]MBA2945779.1 SpoIIE family protein phosphatase [Streptomyces himalayensis subsp. himalayensis]